MQLPPELTVREMFSWCTGVAGTALALGGMDASWYSLRTRYVDEHGTVFRIPRDVLPLRDAQVAPGSHVVTSAHTLVAWVLVVSTIAVAALAVRGRRRARAVARVAAPSLAVVLVGGAGLAASQTLSAAAESNLPVRLTGGFWLTLGGFVLLGLSGVLAAGPAHHRRDGSPTVAAGLSR